MKKVENGAKSQFKFFLRYYKIGAAREMGGSKKVLKKSGISQHYPLMPFEFSFLINLNFSD